MTIWEKMGMKYNRKDQFHLRISFVTPSFLKIRFDVKMSIRRRLSHPFVFTQHLNEHHEQK